MKHAVLFVEEMILLGTVQSPSIYKLRISWLAPNPPLPIYFSLIACAVNHAFTTAYFNSSPLPPITTNMCWTYRTLHSCKHTDITIDHCPAIQQSGTLTPCTARCIYTTTSPTICPICHQDWIKSQNVIWEKMWTKIHRKVESFPNIQHQLNGLKAAYDDQLRHDIAKWERDTISGADGKTIYELYPRRIEKTKIYLKEKVASWLKLCETPGSRDSKHHKRHRHGGRSSGGKDGGYHNDKRRCGHGGRGDGSSYDEKKLLTWPA